MKKNKVDFIAISDLSPTLEKIKTDIGDEILSDLIEQQIERLITIDKASRSNRDMLSLKYRIEYLAWATMKRPGTWKL